MGKLRKAAIIFFGIIFLFSSYQAISSFYRNYKGNQKYEQIQSIYEKSLKTLPKTEKEQPTQQSTENPTQQQQYGMTPQELEAWKEERKRNFLQLQEQYPEMVGWIYLEDSNINYPVMQSNNNDKYLNRLMDGSWHSYGSIFLDYRNSADFSDKNNVLYGHNMVGGAMFANLMNFKNKDYFETHKVFTLETAQGIKTCTVFSAYVTKGYSDSYQLSFDTAEDYEIYLKQIQENSIYSTQVDVSTQDKILTLSTCTNVRDVDRFIVHAVIEDSE